MQICSRAYDFTLTLAAVFLALAAGNAAASSPQYYYPVPAITPSVISSDICIYGATSAGVVAAVEAARMGKSVSLVEFGSHVGGMTTGGLSKSDISVASSVGGIAKEFYQKVGTVYGQTVPVYNFEPHVAENVYLSMLQQAGVQPYFLQRLSSVTSSGGKITQIAMENGNVFQAKEFIDTTYEGDLMAMAGVSWTIGRESAAQYGETLAGLQFPGPTTPDFNAPLSAYAIPNNPTSGYIAGITKAVLGAQGSADPNVMSYCFRICVTQNMFNSIPVPKPANYDPNRYLMVTRYLLTNNTVNYGLLSPIPNGKYDLNNFGLIGLDDVGPSTAWATADYPTRERIFQEHVTFDQGFLWFMAWDPRIPLSMRGFPGLVRLPQDEFTDSGNWPRQLYVREARRMVSDYVMTQANCMGTRVATDSIGLASYPIDSHVCQRYASRGYVHNEGWINSVKIPGPYPISYRSIVPASTQCSNLLVPVCLSATHVALCSIRMEPVYMILGQSAGAAASLAIDQNASVQQVSYPSLKAQLIADNQILSP